MKVTIMYVEWKDSASYKEWYNRDEIKETVGHNENICSVGFVIDDRKDEIVLALNVDAHACSTITVIPKCSIVKEKILKSIEVRE